MCYEERVLYRLFSGLHTSTNIHINWMYYPPRKGVRDEWAPNPARFVAQYKDHPEWLDNLYFAYVVLLRAVKKSSDLLEHHDFDVGMPEQEVTRCGRGGVGLAHRLLCIGVVLLAVRSIADDCVGCGVVVVLWCCVVDSARALSC